MASNELSKSSDGSYNRMLLLDIVLFVVSWVWRSDNEHKGSLLLNALSHKNRNSKCTMDISPWLWWWRVKGTYISFNKSPTWRRKLAFFVFLKSFNPNFSDEGKSHHKTNIQNLLRKGFPLQCLIIIFCFLLNRQTTTDSSTYSPENGYDSNFSLSPTTVCFNANLAATKKSMSD